MYKTIKDYNIKDKKVIIRCDFNVPIEDGIIKDDSRIRKSLRTIRYARKEGAKVILLSHLGRVKSEEDKQKYSLEPVCEVLSKLLRKKVKFFNSTRGKEIIDYVNNMKARDVVLLQNTRFEDLNNGKESKNSRELGKYWASLGDIFINDAFGTIHRSHASNVGISKYLKSGIGFLVEKEIKELGKLDNPKRPYTIILGGSKVSDKINLIKNLAKNADYLLIGGAMAFTFLKAAGFNIGSSLCEKDQISFCAKMLDKYPNKIILPIDIVVSTEINEKAKITTRFINEIEEDEIGLDIGKKTVEVFKQYIDDSKTIFWNGPMGYFEISKFSKGTKKLCDAIANSKAYKIIGGGDTARAVTEMGFEKQMNHISTGGGASLSFLEGIKLEALELIDEK